MPPKTEPVGPVHCRLFFLLARNANMGVIFRRGPSQWVQIIRWDTEHDTFEPGQWFHGRIYEKRCDLSPDGTLMIYFANKINNKTIVDKEYTYAWTAISRPPYLTALALWPKGDCWNGGGLFETNDRVWLNHFSDRSVPHPDHLPQGIELIDKLTRRGEDTTVFIPRIERDGWILEQKYTFTESQDDHYISDQSQIYRKPNPDASLTLVMTSTYVPPFEERTNFTIRHKRGDRQKRTEASLSNALWADWDHRGRLVFVRDGKLFTGSINHKGELDVQELAAFDAARVYYKVAPDWAKTW